jgi:serine/threonine-protein kinase HipA
LKTLAEEVARVQADGEAGTARGEENLRHLMLLGGSPQGARPKVLVDLDPASGVLTSGFAPQAGARPWLIKFPAAQENREVSAIEELYARLARAGGMDMPPSRFFDLGRQHSAFGVRRFDRQLAPAAPSGPVLRVPILSLSALLQADFRLPSLDYETVLLATQRITGDRREVLKAFERCVFNVLVHNRDDHGRNFAFRLDAQGLWKLSPAFDLTYSFGPGGEHATSVAGHGAHITRGHLLKVAKQGGVEATQAARCIDHWTAVVRGMASHVQELPIRQATLQNLLRTTAALCDTAHAGAER